MPLGTEVLGLSPGHIVLDGDPAPPPRKGPCLLSLAKRSSISATAALLCKVTTHGVFYDMLHTIVIKNGPRHFGTWDGTVRHLGLNCL